MLSVPAEETWRGRVSTASPPGGLRRNAAGHCAPWLPPVPGKGGSEQGVWGDLLAPKVENAQPIRGWMADNVERDE
jgi:hypothetical protein